MLDIKLKYLKEKYSELTKSFYNAIYFTVIIVLFLLLFHFDSSDCNMNNSEFVLKKKNINQSSSKIRETILTKTGDILKLDLKLGKISINLRSFLLKEIDEYLEDNNNSFLLSADKAQLQESLEELIDFKNKFEQNINDLEKKLGNLKYKFNLKIKENNG